jgi:hypothetical protein
MFALQTWFGGHWLVLLQVHVPPEQVPDWH